MVAPRLVSFPGASEAASSGTDTLILRGTATNTVATTLTLAATLENLNAGGTAGTLLNLTGNALANVLTGNEAANILDGGTGIDTLIGGVGNDTYLMDLDFDATPDRVTFNKPPLELLAETRAGVRFRSRRSKVIFKITLL